MKKLPLAPRDTLADARRRRRARRRERQDREYLAWMAEQERCVITVDPCEGDGTTHHHPSKSAEGGSVWHDRKSLRLCQKHHQHPIVGVHAMQTEDFEARYEVDLDAEVQKFNDRYDSEMRW